MGGSGTRLGGSWKRRSIEGGDGSAIEGTVRRATGDTTEKRGLLQASFKIRRKGKNNHYNLRQPRSLSFSGWKRKREKSSPISSAHIFRLSKKGVDASFGSAINMSKGKNYASEPCENAGGMMKSE